MTLIERIRDLAERCDGLADLDEKQSESKSLHSLQTDATLLARDLGEQVNISRLLGDQGIECDIPQVAKHALNTLSKLKSRYDKHMRADQLTQGRDWTRFKEQIVSVCNEAEKVNKEKWREFVELAYSGQNPKEVETSLGLTDGNKRNLPLYQNAFMELTRYSRSVPKERADFDRVRDAARQLTEIYQQFDFRVSDSVKRFLKAVGEGGADLSLLTEEVVAWLEENKSTNKYRIVAKGRFQ